MPRGRTTARAERGEPVHIALQRRPASDAGLCHRRAGLRSARRSRHGLSTHGPGRIRRHHRVVSRPDDRAHARSAAGVSLRAAHLDAGAAGARRQPVVRAASTSSAVCCRRVYETRLELRRPSRLVIIGDLRVPRVTVRHEPLGTSARVTVDASPDTRSTIAQEAGRLTIRFEADALDVVMPPDRSRSAFVQGIRVLDATALAVDLGPRFGSYRAAQSTAGSTARLVLDLLPAPTETLTLTPTSPAAAPPATTAAPPPLGDLPVFGRQPSPIRTITIDPGHGGDDAGVRGRRHREKDSRWRSRGGSKAAIEARLGIRVLLTRDDDRERARSTSARRSPTTTRPTSSSACTRTRRPGPAPAARRSMYAAFESPTSQTRAGMPSRGCRCSAAACATSSSCPGTWRRPAIVDQSDGARGDARRAAPASACALDARPIERAPLRVLESANMPAVLIEMGYLTNPEQEKRSPAPIFQNDVRRRPSSTPSSDSATRCRRREANDDGATRPARRRRDRLSPWRSGGCCS